MVYYVFLGYYYYLFILVLVTCFISLIMILYLLIINRGKLIFKLALFVYLFFPTMYKTSNL